MQELLRQCWKLQRDARQLRAQAAAARDNVRSAQAECQRRLAELGYQQAPHPHSPITD